MSPIKVATFPRDPNPYQELLHRALGLHGVAPHYLPSPTPSRTLNLLLLPVILTRARLSGTRILHLHWVFAFALPGSAAFPPVRAVAQLWFGLVLLTCRALRIRVVWTAHNVLPHDQVFWNDRAGRRTLLRSAAQVIVHDKRVTADLTDLLRPADALPPMSVVPHGSYTGWYDQDLGQAAARERLGLPHEALVLVFFGRVSAQKGVEELAAAFSLLCAVPPSGDGAGEPVLVIAGRCTDDRLAGSLAQTAAALPGRIRLDLRFLPDDELAGYLTAADAAVLPFRTATTSGSAVLAMTIGRVAVLPDLAAFDDLPDDACLRYDHADPDGLRGALVTVCATSRQELTQRGAAGHAAAGTQTWDEAGRLTAEVYRSTLGEPAGVSR